MKSVIAYHCCNLVTHKFSPLGCIERVPYISQRVSYISRTATVFMKEKSEQREFRNIRENVIESCVLHWSKYLCSYEVLFSISSQVLVRARSIFGPSILWKVLATYLSCRNSRIHFFSNSRLKWEMLWKRKAWWNFF